MEVGGAAGLGQHVGVVGVAFSVTAGSDGVVTGADGATELLGQAPEQLVGGPVERRRDGPERRVVHVG